MRQIIVVIMMAICWRLLRSVIVSIVPTGHTRAGLLLTDQPETFGWIEVNGEFHYPQDGILKFIATREGTQEGQSLWRINHVGQEIEYQGFFCDIHRQLVEIPFNGELLEPANDGYCIPF